MYFGNALALAQPLLEKDKASKSLISTSRPYKTLRRIRFSNNHRLIKQIIY